MIKTKAGCDQRALKKLYYARKIEIFLDASGIYGKLSILGKAEETVFETEVELLDIMQLLHDSILPLAKKHRFRNINTLKRAIGVFLEENKVESI